MPRTPEIPAAHPAARAALEGICTLGAVFGGMLVLMVYFSIDWSGPSLIRLIEGCAILGVFWYFDLNGRLNKFYKARLDEAGFPQSRVLITRAKRRSALIGACGMSSYLAAFWLFYDAGRSELSQLALVLLCLIVLAFVFDRWMKSWVGQLVAESTQPPRDI
jgi:hypothetical protein